MRTELNTSELCAPYGSHAPADALLARLSTGTPAVVEEYVVADGCFGLILGGRHRQDGLQGEI
jgi:hypothetical protein